MKKNLQFRKRLGLVLAGLLVFSTVSFHGAPKVTAVGEPYYDTNLTFEERATDLISSMTLAEKISQLNTSAPAIPRLGIPAYNWWQEALHGVAWNRSVSFPSSLSMSLSWDRGLLQETASIIGDESRAYFTSSARPLSNFTPTVNMQRDPRWGRNEEGYGEDPFLVGELGAQYVIGIQGNNDTIDVISPAGEKYLKTIATVKHYAANNSEQNRYNGTADMDNRTLREYYTYQFRNIAEKAHPASVMTAYNRVNGIPMFAHTYLNNTMLRKTWGFDGYIVSDCDGVANITNNHRWIPADPPGVYTSALTVPQSVAFSLMGGTDLACNWTSGTGQGGVYTNNMQTAINQKVQTDNGIISEEDVDRALVRMFTQRMRTGEFDSASGRNVGGVYGTYTTANRVETAGNVASSLKASREGVALLKNTGVLPIDTNTVKSIAVVGKFNDVVELGDSNYAGSPTTRISFKSGLTTALNAKGFDTANNLKFYSPGAGSTVSGYIFNFRDFNINGDTYAATSADTLSNCQKETSNIGYINDGSYAIYKNVNFEGEIKSFSVSVSTNGASGNVMPVVEVRADDPKGKLLAKATCVRTSAWANYTVNTGQIVDGLLHNSTTLCFVFTTNQSTAATDLTPDDLQAIGNADMAIYLAGTGKSGSLNVAGENSDRANMNFPANQVSEILQVADKNPNTVVAIQAVGMMNIGDFADKVKAITFTSFNGQFQGQAMAEVLLGDVNPSGRLSFSWYKNESDLPGILDYEIRPTSSKKGRTYQYFTGDVLYPFGYGLSYSTFDYSNPTISKTTVSTAEKFNVTVDVENISDKAGAEVVQVYIAAPGAGNGEVPIKQLKGFERVELAAHEKKTVVVELNSDDFWFIDSNQKRVVEEGAYKVQIGRSCENIVKEFALSISGKAAPWLKTVTLMGDKIKVSKSQSANTSLYLALSDETFIEPSQASVVYSSNRPDVAAVDQNGKITSSGTFGGTAVITAAVTYGGKTLKATYAVVSEGEPVGLTGISVNGRDLSGFAMDKYYYETVVSRDLSRVPTVKAAANVPDSFVTVTQAASVPGEAKVSLNYNGAVKEYTVYFGYAPESDSLRGSSIIPQWSVLNPNGNNLSIGDGALVITTEDGDVWQTTNTAKNIVSQPAAGDWTATVTVQFPTLPTTSYQQGGIMVYDDFDNFLKMDMEYNGRRLLQLAREEGAAFTAITSTPSSGNFALSPDNSIVYRIVRSADTYAFSYSVNGGASFTALGAAQAMSLKQPKIALIALNNSGTAAQIPVRYTDFNVNLVSPVIPSDFISYEKDGSIHSEYYNPTSAQVKGTFLLAVYKGESGVLADVFVKDLDVAAGELAEAAFDLDVSKYKGFTIKAFAWDVGYVPLAKAVTVQ